MPNNINSPIYAHMGYVGSLQIRQLDGFAPIVVRVTSSDIMAKQNIEFPEVVDGRIDQTVYQLGPKIVEGSASFPLIHEGSILPGLSSNCTSNAETLAAELWAIAAERDQNGRMFNEFYADVNYCDNTSITYPTCLINKISFNVTQQADVKVDISVIGGADPTLSDVRIEPWEGISDPAMLSPARIVTWNDVVLQIYDSNGSNIVTGAEVRSFTCNLDNKIDRYFTLNGTLAPQDIAAKKRQIDGTFEFMGRNTLLDNVAYTQDQQYTSRSGIGFGYKLGSNNAGTIPYWANGFYGVIWNILEMKLSTDIFVTNTTWRATGACDQAFLATQLGTSVAIGYPQGQYGASSSPGFPGF